MSRVFRSPYLRCDTELFSVTRDSASQLVQLLILERPKGVVLEYHQVAVGGITGGVCAQIFTLLLSSSWCWENSLIPGIFGPLVLFIGMITRHQSQMAMEKIKGDKTGNCLAKCRSHSELTAHRSCYCYSHPLVSWALVPRTSPPTQDADIHRCSSPLYKMAQYLHISNAYPPVYFKYFLKQCVMV